MFLYIAYTFKWINQKCIIPNINLWPTFIEAIIISSVVATIVLYNEIIL